MVVLLVVVISFENHEVSAKDLYFILTLLLKNLPGPHFLSKEILLKKKKKK